MNETTTMAAQAGGRDAENPKRLRGAGFWSSCLFFFGIVLPSITLLFEGFSSVCAESFFDPLPTVWHVLLVAMVPGTNLLAWNSLRRPSPRGGRWLDIAQGLAVAVSAYYAILFLPLTPMAVMGLGAIVYFGVGLFALLPLSPILALIASLRYRALRVRARTPGSASSGLWPGLFAGVVLLAALAAPDIATRVGLRMAASEEPETSRAGIRLLRRIHDHDLLLRACYGQNWFMGARDVWEELLPTRAELTAERARALFYRVTGEAFDSQPPPEMRVGRGRRWAGTDEFDFDDAQSGEKVAGRLRGLSLVDSRLDGTVYADAATAYLEWTLVFRNDHQWSQREARAQVQLPPGAVVSRLTLWVNGEEREAAFGGRSRVREAYRKVVQVQRRDPVLVNTCGPDRLLVQCFPVEPKGGTMKARLGITVPLAQLSPDGGVLTLPRILERNFGIPVDRKHAVWIEGSRELTTPSAALLAEGTPSGGFALRGALDDNALNHSAPALRTARNAAALTVWSPDRTVDDGHHVQQRLVQETVPAPDRVVLLVDGSKGMRESLDDVADALSQLRSPTQFGVLFAGGDVTRVIAEPTEATPATVALAGDDLLRQVCEGGQDNAEALAQAWDWAAQTPRGVVVWIHAPARYLLSEGEALRQRFERRPGGPAVYALQTATGPHRLVEKLDGLPQLREVPRYGTVSDDLGALLQAWQTEGATWTVRRERVATADAPPEGKESTSHLVRLWAYGRISELFANGNPARTAEATELGVRYSLVTPLTGAVVLETQQQYDAAGLKPVDPTSVPTVPEPETWAMMAIALVMVTLARVRRLRRCSPTR